MEYCHKSLRQNSGKVQIGVPKKEGLRWAKKEVLPIKMALMEVLLDPEKKKHEKNNTPKNGPGK